MPGNAVAWAVVVGAVRRSFVIGGEVVAEAAAAAVAGCNSAADWSIKLRNLWALTVRARRSTVDWRTACVCCVCVYPRDRVFSTVRRIRPPPPPSLQCRVYVRAPHRVYSVCVYVR